MSHSIDWQADKTKVFADVCKGDTVASADATGVVKIWDLRTVTERASIATSDKGANKCSFDNSGSFLAVPSDSGSIRV